MRTAIARPGRRRRSTSWRSSAAPGGGYDIKIYDFERTEMRQITNGEGSNESPAYSPNGKHIAFTSTRSGKTQIYTVGRDGKDIRQVTKVGNNFFPDWSR